MGRYYYNRQTQKLEKLQPPSIMQSFLYKTVVGNFLLENIVAKKWFSEFSGLIMDMPFSCIAIKSFIRKNNIDMSLYEDEKYSSFNSFFTRHIKPENRPFDKRENAVVAPCDAKVLAYKINEDTKLRIKGNTYNVVELVGDDEIADEYKDGICLVFRLSVDDYHRYAFIDSGRLSYHKDIPGELHTVAQISSEKYRIYVRNSREVSVLDTDNFGRVAEIEVGALMVGKIVNKPFVSEFEKGQEKGYFCFGGSTIVLMFKKGTIRIDKDIAYYSQRDIEVRVRQGQKIGLHK